MLEQLITGFGAALTFTNILFIAAGITLGIVIGAIPGLGSVTSIGCADPGHLLYVPIGSNCIFGRR